MSGRVAVVGLAHTGHRFAIGDDQYGVDIMAVREIKGWSEYPSAEAAGIRTRRAQPARVIVPIIDLRCRFGQGMTEATALHIVIHRQIASRKVGLLADRVLTSFRSETRQVQRCPGRQWHASRLPVGAGDDRSREKAA